MKVIDPRALLLVVALLPFGCQSSAPPPEPDTSPPPEPIAAPPKVAPVPPKITVNWNDLRGKRVLLVTHPSKKILRSMRTLRRKRLLDADVYIVGVFHDDEIETYDESRAYLRKTGADDMGLMSFFCELNDKNLFDMPNPCTPAFERLLQKSVGIIFTGGPDIQPALYGAPTKLLTMIRAPYRQHWELSMLRQLLGRADDPKQAAPLLTKRPQYPVLGICRGMQALNVALGGTLIQDIPSEIYEQKTYEEIAEADPAIVHRNPNRFLHPIPGVSPFVLHPIKLKGRALRRWYPESRKLRRRVARFHPVVMSAHHQALDKLGHSLHATATSVDGKVIEAIDHGRFANVLGIGFHPEYYYLWDPRVDAKLRRDDKTSNYFTDALGKDKRSHNFHKRIWKQFADLVNAMK